MIDAGVEAKGQSERYVAWMNLDDPLPTRCYVDRISRKGARLRPFGGCVPDEFTLHFSRRGDAKVRCRVTARAGADCAIEFVSSLAIYG